MSTKEIFCGKKNKKGVPKRLNKTTKPILQKMRLRVHKTYRRQEREKGFVYVPGRENTEIVKHLLIAAILVEKKISENLHCSRANQIISQTSFRHLLQIFCSDEKTQMFVF